MTGVRFCIGSQIFARGRFTSRARVYGGSGWGSYYNDWGDCNSMTGSHSFSKKNDVGAVILWGYFTPLHRNMLI